MAIEIEGNIVERIRQRPAMYLGAKSLSSLYHFVTGYTLARGEMRAPDLHLLPSDFHEWVAYRLHFLESTSGYLNMILERTPDEPEALQQFFELLDEHKKRQAKTVAVVRVHPEEPEVYIQGPGGINDRRLAKVSKEIRIVTYTNDPGFFVVHDDTLAEHPRNNHFLPMLGWIRSPYRPDTGFTIVCDNEEFERLSHENTRFKTKENPDGLNPTRDEGKLK